MTRGVHDLGGQPAGPIDPAEHEDAFFDQRVSENELVALITRDSIIGISVLSAARH